MGANPWPADVEASLRSAYECQLTATADTATGPVVLQVEDYDVDITERRSPRWVARLRCALPEAQATLDALDPRALVRVRLEVGYRLPSGDLSTRQVANLHLRRRQVDRPASVMLLEATSDEALAIDAQAPNPNTDGTYTVSSFDAQTFIANGITALLDGSPAAGPTIDKRAADLAVQASYSRPIWDECLEVADALNADVFDDGDRVFRIWPRPTLAGQVVAVLATGPNGTLTETSSGVNRDDWANSVSLVYSYRTPEGTDNTVRSFVQVTSGPLRPAVAGWRTYYEEREGQPTQAQADAAARALLRRFLSRSRSMSVTSPPMWWVRPGDTVSLALPLGAQERHLVASVRFTPSGMATTTRLPDESATITGE